MKNNHYHYQFFLLLDLIKEKLKNQNITENKEINKEINQKDLIESIKDNKGIKVNKLKPVNVIIWNMEKYNVNFMKYVYSCKLLYINLSVMFDWWDIKSPKTYGLVIILF